MREAAACDEVGDSDAIRSDGGLRQQTDVVELTEVDASVGGSVRFPDLPESQWRQTRRDDRLAFAFVTYERR